MLNGTRRARRGMRVWSFAVLRRRVLECALLSSWLAAIPAIPAFAQATRQAPAADSLFDMSLEDLMKMDVVTASRIEEKLARSASTISVVTARASSALVFAPSTEVADWSPTATITSCC